MCIYIYIPHSKNTLNIIYIYMYILQIFIICISSFNGLAKITVNSGNQGFYMPLLSNWAP